MPIRILTLNLWGTHGDWEARRPILARCFTDLGPDLITFQESIVTSTYDQVNDLLPPGYSVVHQDGRSPDGTGACIASRLPLGGVNQSSLHVTPRVDPRHGWIGSVAAFEVRCPDPIGGLLLVHHKPSWQFGYERERELQAVAAARFVDKVLEGREMHVVLAGDLDAIPDAASIRFLKGVQSLEDTSTGYLDAWEAIHPHEEGHTFSPRNPLVATGDMPLEQGRRIDYIFVRRGVHGPSLRVKGCSLVLDEPIEGTWASDHFGVVADLDVP